MNPEIVRVREDGDLVTLRATRRFLEDLIVFLKDVPAISEEFWGYKDHYVGCENLLEDLQELLEQDGSDTIEFQRDETYFFFDVQNAILIDLSGIALNTFLQINTLSRGRIEEISARLQSAYSYVS